MAEQIDQRGTEADGSPSGFDFVSVIDSIYLHRWLILGVFVLVFATGFLYALVASPVYQAKVILQLEQTGDTPQRTSNEYVGDVSAIVGTSSNADGEMQILGSKSV